MVAGGRFAPASNDNVEQSDAFSRGKFKAQPAKGGKDLDASPELLPVGGSEHGNPAFRPTYFHLGTYISVWGGVRNNSNAARRPWKLAILIALGGDIIRYTTSLQ